MTKQNAQYFTKESVKKQLAILKSVLLFLLCMMQPTCFTPYATFLARFFQGKVQKLPLDVGATCPVRDGSIARMGCAFCNGRSFVPALCNAQVSVNQQIADGKRFFLRKVPRNESLTFLAYFQAGSNTYPPVREMSTHIDEALSAENVGGVVLATRPDCLTDSWIDYLRELRGRTFVMVELGMESVNDGVLSAIGRGHNVHTSQLAAEKLAAAGVPVCAHFILGLPGESRADMLKQAETVSQWPVDVVKLHQLQILKGARMAADFQRCPENYHLFELEEYVHLVADYLERLDARIAVERFVSQSPVEALIAPRWGVKSEEVVRRVLKLMAQRDTSQGCFSTL